MRNLKFIMSYRGTNYHGFQRQDNAVTVQGTVEAVLSRIFCEPTAITGCSRTDTGVHARGFCFSVKTEKTVPCAALVKGCNALLPDDIAIFSAEEADADFHPRYDAVAKEYEYLIHTGETRDPFSTDLMYHYKRRLDVRLFEHSSAAFLGTHDFAAFCASGSEVKTTVRTIYSAGVRTDGSNVIFTICGDGFLYNMVRIIVGTLLEVNEGSITAEELPAIIDSRDRKRAGRTAPAHGLYLNRVLYRLELEHGNGF